MPKQFLIFVLSKRGKSFANWRKGWTDYKDLLIIKRSIKYDWISVWIFTNLFLYLESWRYSVKGKLDSSFYPFTFPPHLIHIIDKPIGLFRIAGKINYKSPRDSIWIALYIMECIWQRTISHARSAWMSKTNIFIQNQFPVIIIHQFHCS